MFVGLAQISELLEAKLEAKLEPIREAISEHASRTVSASSISDDKLEQVRGAMQTIVVPSSSDGTDDALDRLLRSSSSEPNAFW